MPQSKNNPAECKNRIASNGDLLLYGVIGDYWEGMDALTIVEELEAMSGDTINVRIHSPGGNFMEGLAMYNRLKMSAKTVNVMIDGLAASMASVIALAGNTVKMPSNAFMMIHKPMNMVFGTAADMRKMADTIDGFEADIIKIYMQRFTGTQDELVTMLADETWLNAEAALAAGFIDEIVGEVKIAASLDITNFKNPPAALSSLLVGGFPTAQPASVNPGATTMPQVKNADAGAVKTADELAAEATAAAAQALATAPPPAATVSADAVAAAVHAAMDARVKQQNDIRALGTSVRLTDAEITPLLTLNMDQARDAILKVVAARDANQMPTSHITVSNNTGDLRQAIATGLMVRAGMAPNKDGNSYAYASLMDIAKAVLQAHGVHTHGMAPNAIATQAMHTTSDFANILADVANKSLRAGYDAYPRTFLQFTRNVNAKDFKNVNRIQLGEAPALEKVNEKGEFKYGTMGDGKETYALQTYGKIFAVTRQTVINDDLDALTRVPQSFGDAAADLENATVWGLITANGAMSDGVALFHNTHKNLGTAGVPSETTLSEARKKMRTQKALNGTRNLNLSAAYALVPAALETTFQKLLTSVIANATGDVNVFANSLQLIVEPLLDDASATAWYLAANPSRVDTIEYAYLTGQEGVYIETREGFNVDGVEIKARLDFGAGKIDHRGLLKNAGA